MVMALPKRQISAQRASVDVHISETPHSVASSLVRYSIHQILRRNTGNDEVQLKVYHGWWEALALSNKIK
ncbi:MULTISPECIES: hypothetical protein [unclassified Undibacterium]|uniref:hypothetical protein n=1 Tax=unclassified Undibacterium TaxID=2630295 RepID=UPI002B230121|nr:MULTISPECIES: hypothetical protein [unclassified Undibacterium]